MKHASLKLSPLFLTLTMGTRLTRCRDSLVEFDAADGEVLRIDAQFSSVAAILEKLAYDRIDLAGTRSTVLESDGASAVDHLESCLQLLQQAKMCEYVLDADDLKSDITISVSPNFRFGSAGLGVDETIILSRFSYVRRDGKKAILESPEALCRINFTSHHVWTWLGLIMSGTTPADLCRTEGEAARFFAELLWKTGFVEKAGAREAHNRACWEFHDLLFHWQSREGRTDKVLAGTYRYLGAWPSPPAIKPRMSRDTLVLPKPTSAPDTDGLLDVLERRRSIRDQDTRPIELSEIGLLLYHALRVQRRIPGERQELLLRPVPAAGGIHELETYVVIDKCADLDRGLYHYHTEHHTLHRLAAAEPEVAALIGNAAVSWAKPTDPPQALIILASRLPRLAWKYEGMAYRFTLLNAGAVIQSL